MFGSKAAGHDGVDGGGPHDGEVGDEQRRSKLKERPKTHIGRCRVVRMTQSVIGFGGLFGFSGGRDEVFTGLIAVIFVFLLSHCCTKMVLVCLAPGTADVFADGRAQHLCAELRL